MYGLAHCRKLCGESEHLSIPVQNLPTLGLKRSVYDRRTVVLNAMARSGVA